MLDLVRRRHETNILTSQVITKSRVVIWSDILYISFSSTLKTQVSRRVGVEFLENNGRLDVFRVKGNL